jgi:hypothetical protein
MDPLVAAEQRRARNALSSVLGAEYHLDVLDLGVDSTERREQRVETRKRASGSVIDGPVKRKGKKRRRAAVAADQLTSEHLERESAGGPGGGSTALYDARLDR